VKKGLVEQLGLEKGQLGLVAQLKIARAVKKGLAEQLKFEKNSKVLFSSWGLRRGSWSLLRSCSLCSSWGLLKEQ